MSELFWDVQESAGERGLRSPESRMSELEGRVDRLAMICCAMWTILQSQTDLSDEELVRMVQDLDLSDGSLDGKARIRQVSNCTACGRPVAARHIRCLYCGATRCDRTPFDAVM